MNFIQRYRNLNKQRKIAYKDMQAKREQILCMNYDIKNHEDACLKMFPFPVFGVDVDDKVKTVDLEHCGMFCNDAYCSYLGCKMCRKNHAYIDAVKLYKSVKTAQWNLVKEFLHFKEH